MARAKKVVPAKKKLAVKKKLAAKKKKTTIKRKAKKVSPIPKGYNSITPYLIVNDGAGAIAFYKKVFDAKEIMRMERDGKVSHAELKIGDAKIMLSSGCAELGARSPEHFGGSPVSIYLYTKNVDAVVDRAVAAGAILKKPVQDMFYGDRSGGLEDPYGHTWFVATHIEDVSLAELRKRAAEVFGKKH